MLIMHLWPTNTTSLVLYRPAMDCHLEEAPFLRLVTRKDLISWAGLSRAVIFIVHCPRSTSLLDKGVVVLLCMKIALCGATSYMLHAVWSSISYAPGPMFAANVLPISYNQSNKSTRTPGRGTVFQLRSDGQLFSNETAMIHRP